MNDIAEIERRLEAALTKIAAGKAHLPANDGAGDQEAVIATLRQQLAQKTEELEGAKVQSAEDSVQQNAAQIKLQSAVKQLENSTGQLQESNTELRNSNDALRTAYADQSGDGAVLNAGLEAELKALRAERKAEKEYLQALLHALQTGEGE